MGLVNMAWSTLRTFELSPGTPQWTLVVCGVASQIRRQALEAVSHQLAVLVLCILKWEKVYFQISF